MFAMFVGAPGIFELLILGVICGGPVIAVVLLLILRPWQNRGNLAACPDCGHFVSLLAKACPKCGRPLQE